jgi:hypothetical protein
MIRLILHESSLKKTQYLIVGRGAMVLLPAGTKPNGEHAGIYANMHGGPREHGLTL